MINETEKLRLHKLFFFMDAVYAIILTLLVLDLHIPELANANSMEELFQKLGNNGSHFVSFLLSFLVVWESWQAQNSFSTLVVKYDNVYAAFCVLLLLQTVTLPFSAALI